MPQLIDWLRQECEGFAFSPAGVLQTDGCQDWPLLANDIADLVVKLDSGGFLSPLPSESAALANVIEVAVVDHLVKQIDALAEAGHDVRATRGAPRGYPDLEVEGGYFGGGYRAVDVKLARIRVPRDGTSPTKTESRITLYTGNTYFRYPQLKIGGIRRPFDDYREHLDIVGLYIFDENSKSRVTSLELLVHEPWRIASRERSSTTREYIGAVEHLESLRSGVGAFSTAQDFYRYWREEYKGFKTPRLVEKELDKQLKRPR